MRKSDWDLRRGIENLSTELTAQVALARVAAIAAYAAVLTPATWGAARLILFLFRLTDASWNRSAEMLLPGFVLVVLLILGSRGWLPGTNVIPRIPLSERAVRNVVIVGAVLVFLLFFERPFMGVFIELPFLGLGSALAAVRWTMRRRFSFSDLAAFALPLVSAVVLIALSS